MQTVIVFGRRLNVFSYEIQWREGAKCYARFFFSSRLSLALTYDARLLLELEQSSNRA